MPSPGSAATFRNTASALEKQTSDKKIIKSNIIKRIIFQSFNFGHLVGKFNNQLVESYIQKALRQKHLKFPFLFIKTKPGSE